MAMAMRAAATSRICAALLLPPSISAAKKQEARIIGVGNRRGAVWRIATNSCSRILCTRSSWIDSSIKKEESNAVEALALDLAKQAGALILEKSGHALQVDTKESHFDLVTEVDKACEDLLRSQVQAKFPHHFYLGEETATEQELERLKNGVNEADWTWIVDPIDGTLNFVAGMPLSVISIGVAYGGNMEVGVVYNPFNDELFVARRGQGAHMNGTALRVLPPDTQLEDTTVAVGFPSKALHICYVGAGRLGCFFEHNLKPWDVAAARLIVQEAGGRVTDMSGNTLPLTAGSVLASNGGSLHERIVDLIH
ncbi:hypothetical protein BDL97_04G119500 [Sphagnum fallax]|nr:hypothetical protein BDL97_04G119500 [Sphagnum fallax]